MSNSTEQKETKEILSKERNLPVQRRKSPISKRQNRFVSIYHVVVVHACGQIFTGSALLEGKGSGNALPFKSFIVVQAQVMNAVHPYSESC